MLFRSNFSAALAFVLGAIVKLKRQARVQGGRRCSTFATPLTQVSRAAVCTTNMGRLSADEWKRRALQAEAAWGDMKLDLEGGQGTLAEPEKGMGRMVGLVHTCSNLGAAVFTTTCKILGMRLWTKSSNSMSLATQTCRMQARWPGKPRQNIILLRRVVVLCSPEWKQ